MITKKISSFSMLMRPLLLMAATLALAIAYISCDALMQEKGDTLTQLKQDTAAVDQKNAALKAEIATLSSADRIEGIAVQTLGMREATEDDIVYYTTKKQDSDQKVEAKSSKGHGLFSAFQRIFTGS
jgi:cell division protein FtsL